MIDEAYGKYILSCDICYNEESERYSSKEEAIRAKKALGYATKKDSDGWIDICSECQEW